MSQLPQAKRKRRRKNQRSRLNWRELFTSKFFDLFIVIAGVSIAFQLNNWKLASDSRGLERFYLESMVADLRSDQRQIDEVLTALKSDHKIIDDYMKEQNNVGPDSLGTVLLQVLTLETFTPAQNPHQMLLASNGLTAISDRNIRSQTAEYYNRYTSVKRFEEVYTQVLLEVFQYFNPYSDLIEKKILDPGLGSRHETKNFLLISQEQLDDGVDAHSELREKGVKLINAIESYLNR